jgi:hypothetical protein
VSPDTKISGSDRWGIARTDASRALVAYNEYDGEAGLVFRKCILPYFEWRKPGEKESGTRYTAEYSVDDGEIGLVDAHWERVSNGL